MKRLFSFLCLLLSLCLLLPASLVTASAIKVDGHGVYYAWRGNEPQDISFTEQIVSSISLTSIRVQTDIVLSSPIKAKESFELSIDISHGVAGSVELEKVIIYDENNKVLDTLYSTINNGTITISGIQVDGVVNYIRLYIKFTRPQWKVENTDITFSIGERNYTSGLGMTWGEWVDSNYNTIGLFVDNGKIYCTNQKLTYYGNSVNSTDLIVSGGTYKLENLGSVATTINFYVNDTRYSCEYGMTWGQFIDSDYNDGSFTTEYDSDLEYDLIFYNGVWVGEGYEMYCLYSDSIMQDFYYYTGDLINEMYSSVQYLFDYAVTSVSVELEDEKGLLNGVISYLKKTLNSINDLPQKIIDGIINKLKELFIPNDERIMVIKNNFEEKLRGSFGALFDAVDIVDMVADSFVYGKTDPTIKLPAVTVNLAGVPFTFGGQNVDVIPDGFDGIVEMLKLIVNMVSTIWFVMAMKHRLEEVLR